jgi:hypothetical protein
MKRIVKSYLIVPLVVFVSFGCSQPTGPKSMRVWGDVSFDGKPVDDGSITFESTDGAAPAQAQIKAGHYDVPAESGPVSEKTYLIRINALTKTGKTVPNMIPIGGPTMDVMAETIPVVFNAKSAIKKTISPEPAKNQFNFKLMPSGTFE